MINIGKYIEMAINWLTDHFASFFDALSIGIGGFIDGFQHDSCVSFHGSISLLSVPSEHCKQLYEDPESGRRSQRGQQSIL